MAPDETLRDHEALRHARIRFDADVTAIALPRWLLALPNTTWRDDPTSSEWRRRVSEFWNGSLPRLDAAAAMLGTSPRTLQRRLRDDGLTYERLVDQMRLERAVELLGIPMPLAEVSRRVGYQDQAHFTRAFRRWTGTTPGVWHAMWAHRGTRSRRSTADGWADAPARTSLTAVDAARE
jgi:AraC-like DNA-binding protein